MRQKVRSRIQDPVIACVTYQSKITCTKVAYIMPKVYPKKFREKRVKEHKIHCVVCNEVGMSNRVCFWQDCWCGDESLKRGFPALYENSTDQEASMESLMVR